MSSQTKKIVVFGSYNKQSVGDKAILVSLLNLLFENAPFEISVEVICFDAEAIRKEIQLFNWSNSVTVVNFNKQKGNEVKAESPMVRNQLRKYLPSSLLQLVNTIRFYYRFNPAFNTKADLLIIGGGNLLMDLFPSWLIMPYLVSRKLECPYVVAGVGAFPINTPLGYRLIQSILKKSEMNFVRDRKTYDYVKNKFKIDCHLHPDFAFSYPTQAIHRYEKKEKIIAVNIAPVYSNKWPYQDLTKFDHFINIISEGLYSKILKQDPEVKILFFDSNYPTDRDGAIAVINKLLSMGIQEDRLIYKDELLSSTELITTLKNVKYCIVTRLHAGILALDAGLPVLGIAYQPKVKDVFQSVGIGSNVINIQEIKHFPHFLEDFLKNIDNCYLDDKVRKDLKLRNNHVITSILNILN